MDTTLTRHLPVATCIGCGARSHNAECADGCTDLPLDLVDVDDLVAIATRAEALEERVAELREVARALVEDDPVDWSAVHERARAAVLIAVPEAPEADVIEGWGCPRCGRVDAPQQCLGICIRRPGLVADVAEYREYAAHAQRIGGDRPGALGLRARRRRGAPAARPGAADRGEPAVAREGSCSSGRPDLLAPRLAGPRPDLDHAQRGRHERDEPHASSGAPSCCRAPRISPRWMRADHLLAVAGELVERAVAQPDLRPPARQLGLEPDVVEHPHDALQRGRRARRRPRVVDRPRPEPPSGLLGRGLRVVGVVQVRGEHRRQQPVVAQPRLRRRRLGRPPRRRTAAGPGAPRSSRSRVANPFSTSRSRCLRTVLLCRFIRSASSRTPIGPPVSRRVSSTATRLMEARTRCARTSGMGGGRPFGSAGEAGTYLRL